MRFVARASEASPVVEVRGRAMSFMTVRLPGGRLVVVSPGATFRLRQWVQAYRASTARRVPIDITMSAGLRPTE